MKTQTAKFARLNRQLPEGREWLVTTPEGHSYLVVFYPHEGQRWGYCQCRAASFNVLRRHLIWAAKSDSILTKVPMRDVAELKRAA